MVDVTVQTYAAISATSSSTQFTYTAASAPTITSLSVSTGSTAGGTSVTITGTNFTAATQVLFGGIPAASYVVNSATSITAISPAQAAGVMDIKVATFSGDSASGSSDLFTYTTASAPTVSSLSVGTGTTAGGTAVTITGTNLSDAVSVLFGSVPASSFTVVNSTTVTAVAPPQAAGTVDCTITTNAGTSATSSADHFVYTNASTPSITSVTANSGSAAGGSTVAIAGSGFTGATAVNFGSVPAAGFTVLSDNSIVATAPPQGAGTIDISVTTFAGTSSTGSSDHYTYNAVSAPTVTALSTSTGSSSGGTMVTITGTNFLTATSVSFGGTQAAFVILSATSIQATAPAQAAGTLDVTVTASGVTSGPVVRGSLHLHGRGQRLR